MDRLQRWFGLIVITDTCGAWTRYDGTECTAIGDGVSPEARPGGRRDRRAPTAGRLAQRAAALGGGKQGTSTEHHGHVPFVLARTACVVDRVNERPGQLGLGASGGVSDRLTQQSTGDWHNHGRC